MSSDAVLAVELLPNTVAKWVVYWQAYSRHFLDPQGRVIDIHRGGISTSEGQSYALFFSLVANEPSRFAEILSWTNDNLAAGQLGVKLPGWLWGKKSPGKWTLLSAHSASDADLWLAYTLIQAGRLWHRPAYRALGLRLAQTIANKEVVNISFARRVNARTMKLSSTPMLLPGSYGFSLGYRRYVFNPSYMPLPLLLGLAQADSTGPWQVMASQLPNFMRMISPKGFAPDWIGLDADGRTFVPPQGDEGSYNAIRVYLWAGMSKGEKPFAQELMQSLFGMAAYLHQQNYPPVAANSLTGQPQGQGPAGFSAAVLPFLVATHDIRAVARQTERLQHSFDRQSGLLGKPAYYYDQNLALFAFGYLSHAFRFSRHGELETWWSPDHLSTENSGRDTPSLELQYVRAVRDDIADGHALSPGLVGSPQVIGPNVVIARATAMQQKKNLGDVAKSPHVVLWDELNAP
ncbi:cellulose synthase complex periplasmic endoglucanase BcsZ [Acidithiobacillus sp. AMEEHan]|uniref:cellulose synthase complex periplasmic endoglucanase BcsZ n=1 Tax=Acidithiobacillus sp. AMEEHan TaxID=2994951 RepID=UPI0027E58709|nr:cellulose synthase complex periplasmic endoglucanase BcsZ [Acidithiobacillus sp. AMEEHan]